MKLHTKESLIATEKKLAELFHAGELPYLLHLSGGNENELIAIFEDIAPEDYVLGSHRSHYHYLLKGGQPQDLINKVVDGRSMFLFNRSLNFMTSSIVAGMAAVAVGLGMAIARNWDVRDGPQLRELRHVWCFLGDGGEDEGHFYEAVRFSFNRGLPVTFIIEDNGRSVDTTTKQRWGNDFHIDWPDNVIRYHYTPTYPHAGTGSGIHVNFEPDAIQQARCAWPI